MPLRVTRKSAVRIGLFDFDGSSSSEADGNDAAPADIAVFLQGVFDDALTVTMKRLVSSPFHNGNNSRDLFIRTQLQRIDNGGSREILLASGIL